MSWVVPGQPQIVEVDDQKIKVKPLTVTERTEIATKIQGLNKDDVGIEVFYDIIAENVLEIPGIKGTPAEILRYQSPAIIVALIDKILGTNTLSESDAGN